MLASIRQLLSTLASVAATRLELLSNELEEALLHVQQMLLYFLFALFCLGMALMLLTIFVVVLFWDTHRLAVLGGAGAVFLVTGLLMVMKLLKIAHARPGLFSVSQAELRQDKEQLDGP